MIDTFPKNIVVWDFETSGFSPQNDRILEVGVAIVKDGEVVDTWSSLLQLDCEIDERATEIHGITKEMCQNEGRPRKEVIARLLQNILDADAHVTHNGTRFDLLFLEEEIRRDPVGIGASQILQNWHKVISSHIDTAALFKAAMMGQERDESEPWHEFFVRILDQPVKGLKYNVGVCCDHFLISREGVQQHRALADVLLTLEIYKKIGWIKWCILASVVWHLPLPWRRSWRITSLSSSPTT